MFAKIVIDIFVKNCFLEDITEAYEARIRQHYLRQGLPPPPRRYRVRTSTTKQSLLTSSTATTSSTESATTAPTTPLATSFSKNLHLNRPSEWTRLLLGLITQCVSCCFVDAINEAYEARIRQHYLRQGLPPPPRRYRVRTSTTKQSLLTSSTSTTSSTESATTAPTTPLATSFSKNLHLNGPS